MKYIKRPLASFAVGLLAAAVLSGCLSSSSGPTSAEKQESQAIAEQGRENLSDALAQMGSSGYRYGKEDLTSLRNANDDFEQALRLNPGNKEAKFGAAITGVLLAAQSQTLSELINRTLEAESPLSPELSMRAPLMRGAVLGKLAATGFPEVHEIQDAVADTLLPALESAITRLQSLFNDPTFSMMLVIDGTPREIDRGEIGVMLAGFKSLHALATLVLSYDLDFDHNGSYEYLRVVDTLGYIEDFAALTQPEKDALTAFTDLLSRTSPFLAVRPAWQTRLAQVDDNVRDALDILKAALLSIKAETDPQDDDILRICKGSGIQTECIHARDFDNALAAVDTARKYMVQPYAVPVADTTIHVNFAAIFGVQDYKKLPPYYTFYPVSLWSNDKPVLYFTNPNGVETGNPKTVADLFDRAWDQDWPASRLIDSLKPIIRWQDPTFQGFLPGGTETKVWRIIQLAAEYEEEDDYYWGSGTNAEWSVGTRMLVKRPGHGGVLSLSSFFSPRFPLILLGM